MVLFALRGGMVAKTFSLFRAQTAMPAQLAGAGIIGRMNHLLAVTTGFESLRPLPLAIIIRSGAVTGYEINITAQRETSGGAAIGTPMHAHQRSVPQIQHANNERTIGIVEGQMILP